MAFHQEISVPVKGQYFLRTAIHDMNSDRVGTVEIPVSAVSHLDPLKTVAAMTKAPMDSVKLPATPAPADAVPAPAAAPATPPSPPASPTPPAAK
jgi:hypothetical protein